MCCCGDNRSVEGEVETFHACNHTDVSTCTHTYTHAHKEARCTYRHAVICAKKVMKIELLIKDLCKVYLLFKELLDLH